MYFIGHFAKRVVAQLGGFAQHFAVAGDGFLVGFVNGRAGQDIVKLVKGHRGPEVVQFLCRIGIAVEPAQCIEKFAGIECVFAVSIALFDFGDVGVAPFKDELHLAAMRRPALHLPAAFLKERFCGGKFDGRVARCLVQLMDHVDIGSRRSAAVVAYTGDLQNSAFVGRILVNVVLELPGDVAVIAVVGITEHSGRIRRQPPERAQIRLAAVKIEIVASGQLQNLRHLGDVAKVIRQPADMGGSAQAALEIALTEEEGAGDGFAGGEIHIAFGPHAACRFQASFFDLFFNQFKKGRIDFFDKVVHRRLALQHGIVGKFRHKSGNLPQVVVAHLHGFGISPEPVHVHVSMTDHMNGIAIGFCSALRVRRKREQ